MKMSYGAQSSYSWFDDAGTRHEVTQAEGGKQGDPDAIALPDRNPGSSGRSGRRPHRGRTDLRISG